MKNETKEPVIEIGMVFTDRSDCKYKVIGVNTDSNELVTIDAHSSGDLEPYSWGYDRFLRCVIEGRLWEADPDKLTVALEEIEALKAELAICKEPATPYHPSRLDYFTAAALPGILSQNYTSFIDMADDAVSIAKTVIAKLDKTE